jgi:aminoglycoside 6'-N-acetyltransferase I
MRRDFWEDDEAKVHEAFEKYKVQNSEGAAITFFAAEDDGRYVGFLGAELRSDFVHGAEASPVWYVEGVYVMPDRRESGVGAFLLSSLEDYVRQNGYSKIASSCDLENGVSESFHKAMGFKEVSRAIQFVKGLG